MNIFFEIKEIKNKIDKNLRKSKNQKNQELKHCMYSSKILTI